jgi:hypothetical protein
MRHLALGLIAFALAACSPKAEAPKAEAPHADPAPPTDPSPPANAKRMAMADCDGNGPSELKDCRINSSDTSQFMFEVRYGQSVDTADGKKAPATIQVVLPGDATLQNITEQVAGDAGVPHTEDIDGDGHAELLVPLETGNVNTTYAIWLMPAGARQFIRVGEATAVDFKKTDSGYIAGSARSSANEWAVQFFKLTDDPKLVPVLTAEVTAKGTPEKITGIECHIMDDGGMKVLKMTPKAAEVKFCAESVVKDVFK